MKYVPVRDIKMSRFGMYLMMGALYFGLFIMWVGIIVFILYALGIF